jgi:hypothetical protein
MALVSGSVYRRANSAWATPGGALLPVRAQEVSMSSSTMPVSDRHVEPDDDGAVDALLDSIHEDAAAVARGLVEIRRLVEHFQAGLTEAR